MKHQNDHVQQLEENMSHWVNVIIEDAMTPENPLPEHIANGLKRIAKIVEISDVAQFRTAELEGIAEAICECTELTEISQLLWQATTAFGFQNFSMFVIRQGRSAAFPSRLCTSLNTKWLERYVDKSYQYVDPVALRASERDGSFVFSELNRSCPLSEEFWVDAEKHNVGRNGFCHATIRPDGSRLGVSFLTSANSHMTTDIVRLNSYDLRAIAEFAIEAFCHLSCGHTLREEDLTVQELKFLHIIATSVSPETALLQEPCYGSNKSLQNSIRRKLGVETIFQAVSVASAKCLFDDLPYYFDEVISPFPKLSGWNLGDQHPDQPHLSGPV